MSNLDPLMSLFDYLGKPAGDILGLQVSKEADKQHIPSVMRYVETKTYKGNVNLYPKSFLDSYFNNQSIMSNFEFESDFPF